MQRRVWYHLKWHHLLQKKPQVYNLRRGSGLPEPLPGEVRRPQSHWFRSRNADLRKKKSRQRLKLTGGILHQTVVQLVVRDVSLQ